MSKFLELQIKLLEKERVELREEIIKLKAENKKQLASTDVSQQRERLCDKCNKENHLQKLTDQAQDLGLGYD